MRKLRSSLPYRFDSCNYGYHFGTLTDIGSLIDKPLVPMVLGHSRVFGTEENPNSFAVFYVVGLPGVVHFIFHANSKARRLLYVTVAVAFLCVIALTYARASIFGALIACYIYYNYGTTAQNKWIPLILGIAIISVIASFILPNLSYLVSE